MADTPQTGETVTPGDSQTTVTTATTPAPVQDNGNAAEVEQLRKDKEKAELRARQLENEKLARDKADEEARQKQLEDKEEWKQIAEQEKAKREDLERERQEAETTQALKLAEDTIFAEFSESAIEVAKEAGLSLKDDSDEAKADFKERMDKISQKVVSTMGVTPNNPGAPDQRVDRSEQIERMRMGDKNARTEIINNLPALDVMRKQAGYVSE